jgi:hypothetical protein
MIFHEQTKDGALMIQDKIHPITSKNSNPKHRKKTPHISHAPKNLALKHIIF